MIQVKNSLNKMLMNTKKTTIIVLVILLFSSCLKKSATENNLSQIKEKKIEKFEDFVIKFYSDSIFQVNRIVFPLESETDSVMNKKAFEEKDPKAEIDTSNYIPRNKNNWTMLITDRSFRKDSVIIVDGIKYIRRFRKTEKYVEESILYAEPEYIFMIVKFRLINDKWYLVDYQNELDNERS